MRENNRIHESYERIVCFPTNRILCMSCINESHINESYIFVSQRIMPPHGKCCLQKRIIFMIWKTNHFHDSNDIRAMHHIYMVWIIHMIAFFPVLRVYDGPFVVLINTTRLFSKLLVSFRQRATENIGLFSLKSHRKYCVYMMDHLWCWSYTINTIFATKLIKITV